jgi:hypothetical protein
MLPVAQLGVSFENTGALLDIKWVIDERGAPITINHRVEGDIMRDKYNSIKQKEVVTTRYTMNAFPIQPNPTEDQLTKAGFIERVDIIMYTAMLDWTDNSLNPKNDIDIVRDTIEYDGVTYKLKNFNFLKNFSNTFGEVVLGAVR